MSTKVWWGIVLILFGIIAILTWILFATPAPAHAPTVDGNNDSPTVPTEPSDGNLPPAPLHERVHVTSPQTNATVGHTVAITGEAPGNWYFEASFPIKIITPEGEPIGVGYATAQSDWMTTDQVPFTASIDITMSYSGPAFIALLRDNPSGLPENDDSLEIPIIVQ